MTRDKIVSFFFIALLVFVVYQIFLIFSPFFGIIFWSAILTFAFYPLYLRIRKYFKSNETVAAFLMTILIFLIVVPPLVILIANIATQAVELYQLATNYVREGYLEQLIDQIRNISFVQKIETNIAAWDLLKTNVTDWILSTSKALTNFSVNQAGIITKNLFFVFFNVLLTICLTFIFLKDGEKIYHFIYQIAPLEEENKKSIFRQINDSFSAVIRGQLLTSLTQACVAGFAFWFLGLPLPIFFGIATFIAALIPVVGAAGVWLPFVIFLAIQELYVKAGILFLIGFFVISLVDNVLKPALIGEKTKLPYFLLFFGILGGLKVYGLAGVFFAPVILSVFFAMAKIYQEKFS